MKNIFKKVTAVVLVCMLSVCGLPLAGLATEESAEPITEAATPAPVTVAEPEQVSEPESAHEPKAASIDLANEMDTADTQASTKPNEELSAYSSEEISADDAAVEAGKENEKTEKTPPESTDSPDENIEADAPIDDVPDIFIVSFDTGSIPEGKRWRMERRKASLVFRKA